MPPMKSPMFWPLNLIRHAPWPASSAVASNLDASELIEEEKTPYSTPQSFFPIRLGQVLGNQYQVAIKLGYGSGSTVWLARDLNRWSWMQEQYYAIKVNSTNGIAHRKDTGTELALLKRIAEVNPKHLGWRYVRKLVDDFSEPGPQGDHVCLVFEPLREPLWLFCRRFVDGVIPSGVLKPMLCMVLEGLDCLHSECHIIHTDMKPDNIMLKLESSAILEQDAREEWNNPLPQKDVEGRTIYLSRNNYGRLRKLIGAVQIMDFDLAVRGDIEQSGPISAEIYRAPEVVLDIGYSYSADIWSLGVMLWDLLEGKKLFKVHPVDEDEYDDATHLAHITALLGELPESMRTGRRFPMFYTPDGRLREPVTVRSNFTFENTIASMQVEEKEMFISFVKRMICWKPEDRSPARELLKDPWLHSEFPEE